MKTPLQELIDRIDNGIIKSKAYGLEEFTEALESVKADAKLLLQKESSRTEEMAIGFTLWKYNNHWEFFAQEDDVVYYKNMDTDEPKTDKELFQEYLKTL